MSTCENCGYWWSPDDSLNSRVGHQSADGLHCDKCCHQYSSCDHRPEEKVKNPGKTCEDCVHFIPPAHCDHHGWPNMDNMLICSTGFIPKREFCTECSHLINSDGVCELCNTPAISKRSITLTLPRLPRINFKRIAYGINKTGSFINRYWWVVFPISIVYLFFYTIGGLVSMILVPALAYSVDGFRFHPINWINYILMPLVGVLLAVVLILWGLMIAELRSWIIRNAREYESAKRVKGYDIPSIYPGVGAMIKPKGVPKDAWETSGGFAFAWTVKSMLDVKTPDPTRSKPKKRKNPRRMPDGRIYCADCNTFVFSCEHINNNPKLEVKLEGVPVKFPEDEEPAKTCATCKHDRNYCYKEIGLCTNLDKWEKVEEPAKYPPCDKCGTFGCSRTNISGKILCCDCAKNMRFATVEPCNCGGADPKEEPVKYQACSGCGTTKCKRPEVSGLYCCNCSPYNNDKCEPGECGL